MVPANSVRVAHKLVVQWRSREQRCRTYFLQAVRRTDEPSPVPAHAGLGAAPAHCPRMMHVSRRLACGSHAAAPAVLAIRGVAAVDYAGHGDYSVSPYTAQDKVSKSGTVTLQTQVSGGSIGYILVKHIGCYVALETLPPEK